MPKKSQFQNLILQQTLQNVQDYAQQPTIIQPALTLPIKPEKLAPLPPAPSFSRQRGGSREDASITIMARTEEIAASPLEAGGQQDVFALSFPTDASATLPSVLRKKKVLRGAALLLSALLVLAIYFTWHVATPTSASPTITQQSYSGAVSSQATVGSNSSGNTNSAGGSSGGLIQVYVVGAIQHPGVYTLPMGARVYQLVQAAGGTLPGADLVALNLAAQLTDGEEIYVLSVGETPPSGYTNGSFVPGGTGTPTAASGQLVNINTASEIEMRQALHVSAATAQKIIAYRTQHGPYTSVDQLLQVVSKSIYDHIKTLVTV